ncbi:hypothetical protein [Amycolatopsis sp. cmx-11-12]|uniref:hypothetical protein n=1 Tax=Amycolatopsis sp. cmx-11-12 TaxID=2785795 RepID=UPI003918643B
MKEDSQSCHLDVPNLGEIAYAQGFTITIDAPTEAVAGVPTERISYRGTGSTSLDLSEGMPLRAALVSAGAASLDIDVTIGVAYYGASLPDPATSPHWSTTGIPLSGDVVTTTSGAGTLPPMSFADAGSRTGLMYASSFGVTITPRKADGTTTAYGTLTGLCQTRPWFQEWSRVEVLPSAHHKDFSTRAVTHLANATNDTDLGDGTLAMVGDRATSTFTAALALDTTRSVSFRFLNLIPASAVLRLTSSGHVTGATRGTDISATVPLALNLTRLSVFGVPTLRASKACRSVASADLTGRGFSLEHGGVLSGTYRVPPFQGCDLASGNANLLLSADGNTMSLTLIS